MFVYASVYTYVLYIHIMYLFNMLLHYIICYYEIGNKLSYPILSYPTFVWRSTKLGLLWLKLHVYLPIQCTIEV